MDGARPKIIKSILTPCEFEKKIDRFSIPKEFFLAVSRGASGGNFDCIFAICFSCSMTSGVIFDFGRFLLATDCWFATVCFRINLFNKTRGVLREMDRLAISGC